MKFKPALFFFLVFPITPVLAADWYAGFGQCLEPSANVWSQGPGGNMEQDWGRYRVQLEEKVKINIGTLGAMPVPPDAMEFVTNLLKIGPHLQGPNPITSPSPGASVDPELQKALEYFRNKEISFAEPINVQSAQSLFQFYNGKKLSGVLLMKDFPLPGKSAIKPDVFNTELYATVSSAISTYLKDRPIDVSQGVDAQTATTLNALKAPVADNAYDSFIVKSFSTPTDVIHTPLVFGKSYTLTSVSQLTAIDGVARTFWGEARGCQMDHLPQFEAIGEVIVNRTEAIVSGSEQGMVDFGRAGSTELPAAQVVSKPLQFSVWNGFSLDKKNLSEISSQIPAGIPDIEFEFQGPLDPNDEKALNHVLCPEIQFSNQVWRRAVDLATLIVMDPARYKTLFSFSPEPKSPIYYYTHGIDLPFAVEQPQILGMQEQHSGGGSSVVLLRGTGNGSCDELELFASRPGVNYSSPVHPVR